MISWSEDEQVEFGKAEIALQVLIVASLVALATETLPDLSLRGRKLLKVFEIFTIIVFVAEYVVRLVLSRRKWGYVFSFFGIIDLLAILPVLLPAIAGFQPIKAFRLLRLFRILKLARYSAAARRIHLALQLIREELVLFGVASAVMLFLASFGIYHFENGAQPERFASVFHCLWWSLTTLTTVGYGDAYPITVGGKCFTFLVLIVGLGVVAVPTGLFASALSRVRDQLEDEKNSAAKSGD